MLCELGGDQSFHVSKGFPAFCTSTMKIFRVQELVYDYFCILIASNTLLNGKHFWLPTLDGILAKARIQTELSLSVLSKQGNLCPCGRDD